jgi:tRNA (cmo5U34)-methyltransferase
MVTMVLTMQFIRPLYRDTLTTSILQGLNDNGCLILVEKVLGEDSVFNRLFIKYYYDLKKKRGYSELEIAQKREALENVLVPYRLMENREMLLRAGFRCCDVFFKWYNFCGMVALK